VASITFTCGPIDLFYEQSTKDKSAAEQRQAFARVANDVVVPFLEELSELPLVCRDAHTTQLLPFEFASVASHNNQIGWCHTTTSLCRWRSDSCTIPLAHTL
jgi:hypothetical protein